jgi:hypothetical protein
MERIVTANVGFDLAATEAFGRDETTRGHLSLNMTTDRSHSASCFWHSALASFAQLAIV